MTSSLSKILCFISALCWLLSLTACGGVETASWTEEVRLHDGRFIEVSRKAMATKGGMLSDAGQGGLKGFELKYAPMGVDWKGPWGLEPVSFELFEGVPYLLLDIRETARCRNKNDTDYPLIIMRWRNGQWEEMAQGDVPLEKASMNLFGHWAVGSYKYDPTKGRITWEIKAREDGYYTERRDAKVIDTRDTVKYYYEVKKLTCGTYNHSKM
jgi:hypothetical protein